MTEKKEMESFSEKDTFLIGKQFGTQAKAGDIYLLHGDLGVGKTVFTKGFAEGLGIEEPITSPTFTLVQVSGRISSIRDGHSIRQTPSPNKYSSIPISYISSTSPIRYTSK